jgi:hypothetical protein
MSDEGALVRRNAWIAVVAILTAIAIACSSGSGDEATTEPSDSGTAAAVADRDGRSAGGASMSDSSSDDQADSDDGPDSGDDYVADTGTKPGSTTSGGGSSATEGRSPAALIAAYETTIDAPSYRFDYAFAMTGIPGAGELAFTGSGAADPANELYEMSMDFSSLFSALAGELTDDELAMFEEMFGSEPMRMIVAGDVTYMKWTFFSAFLGAETEWISFDASALGGGADLTPGASGDFSDPTQLLAYMESLGTVEVVGEETIDGVVTTHYSARVNMSTALEALPEEDRAQFEDLAGDLAGLPDVPYDVWVGSDNLVRRITMFMDFSSFASLDPSLAGQYGMGMTVEMNFHGYGEPVSIQVPAPGDVTDLTESMLFGDPFADYPES